MRAFVYFTFAGLLFPSPVSAQSRPGSYPASVPTTVASTSSGVSRPTSPSTSPTQQLSSLPKEQVDKMYCMFVYSLSGVVVKNPVAATEQCKKMALLKYEVCLAENGGDDPLVPTSTPGRSIRKCASHRNLELEVCDALVDIAKDLRKACEEDELTLFPDAELRR